jgi:hypothetical protein
MRLQLQAMYNPDVIKAPLTIQALPPTNSLPLGRYDTVLIIEDWEKAELEGIKGLKKHNLERSLANLLLKSHSVVQVRAIMQPIHSPGHPVEPVVAYVQYFNFTEEEPNSKMHLVERKFRSVGNVKTPKGDIIALDNFWRPVELVPRFREIADRELSVHNVLERPTSWRITSFLDKECYQAVY